MTVTPAAPKTAPATSLQFFVPGKARQQGNHRVNAHGALYETTKGLDTWRKVIVTMARSAMARAHWQRIDGAARIDLTFFRERPKKHFRTGRYSHLLRDDAPIFDTTPPDGDKLLRAVGDALTTAGVWEDDARLARFVVTKLWANPGEPPGAQVIVREMRNTRPQP